MRLESFKSTQHILHTTATFAVVSFIYPVIYKEIFNSCQLFINGTVNFLVGREVQCKRK